MIDDDATHPHRVGVVPVEGRGSLPFALLHGESLVAVASWALGEAGVELLDFTDVLGGRPGPRDARSWSTTRCAPARRRSSWPRRCAAVERDGAWSVGVRPVTDTVKVDDGRRPGRDRRPRRACSRSPRPWCCPRPWSPRCRPLPPARRPGRPGRARCASRYEVRSVEARRARPGGSTDESDLAAACEALSRLTRPRCQQPLGEGEVLGEGDLEVGGRRGHRRARARSVYVATQPAVSVPANPSRLGARVGREQRPGPERLRGLHADQPGDVPAPVRG